MKAKVKTWKDMITEDYVSFEVAKLLKEKGFDAECRVAYTNYGGFLENHITSGIQRNSFSKKLTLAKNRNIRMIMKQ